MTAMYGKNGRVVAGFVGLAVSLLMAGSAFAASSAPAATQATTSKPAVSFNPKSVDRSGAARVGKASFYAERYFGKKMANGGLMNPHGDNAASMTLPLGTTARVRNLATGQSAVVTVQDRGPYVKGRIIDLSPATAKLIGLTPKQGLVTVEVTPIAVPPAAATVKREARAHDAVLAMEYKNDVRALRSLSGE
jgi:rare lipoprotein A